MSLFSILVAVGVSSVPGVAAAPDAPVAGMEDRQDLCVPIREGTSVTTYACVLIGDYGCTGIGIKEFDHDTHAEHTNYFGVCSRGGNTYVCSGTFDTYSGTDENCVPEYPPE